MGITLPSLAKGNVKVRAVRLPAKLTLPNGEKLPVSSVPYEYPGSLREYIQTECRGSTSAEKLAISTFFPCRDCKGASRIWDPNDPLLN